MSKDNESLIRGYALRSIEKLAKDPFDPSITRGELREARGIMGWYRSSVLTTMESGNLSIEDVREALKKSSGRNAKKILKAIQDI